MKLMRLTGFVVCLVIGLMVGCGNLGGGCRGAGFDADGDGVGETDNCPDDFNADQEDGDDDGIGDVCDNCPEADNEDQNDRDEDGVGDVCDNSPDEPNPGQGDRDNDGIGNVSDNCPDTPNTAQADSDDDGVGDVCDNCPDDANEDQEDTDSDQIGDACDVCPDIINEAQDDSDDDGVGDECDNCLFTPNPDQADEDDNGVGDACEGDLDGDGTPDEIDNCPGINNPDQEDGDQDDAGDPCDNCPDEPNSDQDDADNDGFGDACDNCPDDSNEDQLDTDDDGVGNVCDNCPNAPNPNQNDVCEGDSDSDGVPDDEDNCPDESNPGQADEDDDGVGDICDNCPDDDNADQDDEDNDGDGDTCDNCPEDANADQADTDSDTVGNVCDNCRFIANPDQANSDTDDCGNACDDDCTPGGGCTADPVAVNAGPDQNVCSGSRVTLDASATPVAATLRWSQLPGGPNTGVNNAADPASFIAPASSTGAAQSMTFQATGTASGLCNGTDTVQITTRPLDTDAIGTKSSGAAQPNQLVSLDLADDEDPNIDILWVQDAADVVRVALNQPAGQNVATFTAPIVASTTNLRFIAVGVCTNGPTGPVPAGLQSVSVQRADVEINLPPSINVGDTISLTTFTTVNVDFPGRELLFFASAPGPDDDLPPDTEVTIDQDAGTLTVIDAPDGTVIEIIVRLFGTAGLLDTDSDTITINAD